MPTLDLSAYCAAWDLTDPEPLATTPTSHVFRVSHRGGPAVLKLLTPSGQRDERGGPAALTHFDGHGAVRLLRHDAAAQLLEYAQGDDLRALVAAGEDEQSTLIVGHVLTALHNTNQPPESGLTPLRDRFASLFRAAHTDPLLTRAAQLADTLLTNPLDQRVLHGDLHHENIRHSTRGWLALDPKGLIGERTYDAANALCNPVAVPALVEDEGRLLRHADLLATALAVPHGRLLAFTFAHAALAACWSREDGHNPAHWLAMARFAEPHALA